MAMRGSFSNLLTSAAAQGNAIAAFNVYNLESLTAGVRAAEKTGQSVILAVGERYFGNMRPLSARVLLDALLAVSTCSETESVKIALHLDHAEEIAHCREAITAGFDSVMFDASRFPLSENVRRTREVVEVAHAAGVSVEAELGGLAAGEDSHEFQSGKEVLTDPDQAVEFVHQTGIDALAVSIGTVHGMYRGTPNLDLDRLESIHQKVSIPLVLHGGSGTPKYLLREAIRRGIAKVNVNTEVSLAAVERIRVNLLDKSAKPHFSELCLNAQSAMQVVMEYYIRSFQPEDLIGEVQSSIDEFTRKRQ